MKPRPLPTRGTSCSGWRRSRSPGPRRRGSKGATKVRSLRPSSRARTPSICNLGTWLDSVTGVGAHASMKRSRALGEEQYRLEIGEDWAAASERWAAGGCVYSTSFALMDADDDAVLQRALRQLQALGAKPAAAIFARNLRKCSPLHVPRGHRATTRPNPASLTPRELQVLTLLAGGLRNSEIAARLFCRRRPSTTTSPRSFASSAFGTESNALIEPRRTAVPHGRRVPTRGFPAHVPRRRAFHACDPWRSSRRGSSRERATRHGNDRRGKPRPPSASSRRRASRSS
jgi:hypothetical protein